MDRFLLAENPMAGNTLAIIHTLHPIAILLVYHDQDINVDAPTAVYTYNNPDNVTEQITLVAYHVFTSNFDNDANAIALQKIFKQAWHWYRSYLEWEDNKNE